MTKSITAAQIEAFGNLTAGKEKLPTAIDNAVQVSSMLEQFSLAPENRGGFLPLDMANKPFWNALQESPSAQLLEPNIFRGIVNFHAAFKEEAAPLLRETPSGRKFLVSQVKLVYSFLYNAINPDMPETQGYRDTIKQMFTHFGMGEPMAQAEVIKKTRSLVAIAKAEMKELG